MVSNIIFGTSGNFSNLNRFGTFPSSIAEIVETIQEHSLKVVKHIFIGISISESIVLETFGKGVGQQFETYFWTGQQ